VESLGFGEAFDLHHKLDANFTPGKSAARWGKLLAKTRLSRWASPIADFPWYFYHFEIFVHLVRLVPGKEPGIIKGAPGYP
jgi:hypothetical protein